jgi:hypothetical protein
LPFSCPFRATRSSKRQQRAAQSEGRKSPDSTRDEARFGNLRQTAAKRGYHFFFRLLTGGLLVRIQPEEPLSFTYGGRTFRLIFTSHFLKPVSCGCFVRGQKRPDARASAITFPDHFPEPLHVQHDPVGESHHSLSPARPLAFWRVKTLAAPQQRSTPSAASRNLAYIEFLHSCNTRWTETATEPSPAADATR